MERNIIRQGVITVPIAPSCKWLADGWRSLFFIYINWFYINVTVVLALMKMTSAVLVWQMNRDTVILEDIDTLWRLSILSVLIISEIYSYVEFSKVLVYSFHLYKYSGWRKYSNSHWNRFGIKKKLAFQAVVGTTARQNLLHANYLMKFTGHHCSD